MYEREEKIDETEMRELAAIEAELARFSPTPSRLNRDRTMFLAGRASVKSETSPCISAPTTRRWATALAVMTAVAGCLLVMVVVQQHSIIALRADQSINIVEKPTEQSLQPEQPTDDANYVEPPHQRAFVDDIKRRDFNRKSFVFSEERLLALADSGTLTAGSFIIADEQQVQTTKKTAPACDWPNQTYEPSPPLPYYKLLKQMQAAGI